MIHRIISTYLPIYLLHLYTFFPKPWQGEMAELRGRPMDDLELSKESVFQGGILCHFLVKNTGKMWENDAWKCFKLSKPTVNLRGFKTSLNQGIFDDFRDFHSINPDGEPLEVGGSPLAQRGGLFLDQSNGISASEIHRFMDDVPIKASIFVGHFPACHVWSHWRLAEATTCTKPLLDVDEISGCPKFRTIKTYGSRHVGEHIQKVTTCYNML